MSRKLPGFDDAEVPDQYIREVDRSGKVVWSWSVADHLEQFGLSAEGVSQLRRGVVSGGGNHGILTINNLARVGDNRWHDAGDARFHPENLIIDSREANFIVIIERRSGDVVWRLGPEFPELVPAPQRILEHKLPRSVDQLSGHPVLACPPRYRRRRADHLGGQTSPRQ